MKKSPTDTYVDIELFRNDLKDIDPEFIGSMVSIYKISHLDKQISYLCMTNVATYGYGEEICKWLSLKHDPKRPQQIDILNVYLANGDSLWPKNNAFRLISTCDDDDRFEMIACGWDHLLLLRLDGTVFALGDNYYGQLANISQSSYDTVVNTGLKNVKIIACGAYHSLALTNTNQIYSWGCNANGQLGLDDIFNRSTPSMVTFSDSPIKNIAAGMYYSLFLFEDGQIFRCGYDESYIDDDDQNLMVPTKLPIENVLSVACKNDLSFSFFLDQSSHYYVMDDLDDENEDEELVSLKKLDGPPKSFVEASMPFESSITFGLTPIIPVFESNDPISFIELLDNPDNYDVEFIIGDKRILASKCHLRMSSKYYNRMFSGDWQENKQVIINSYSYDVYYSYLRKLHNGYIQINRYNIIELIDLANCYGDEQLFKHCKTFILTDLNEWSLFTYLPLITKYEINETYGKLFGLTINNILPKINNYLSKNQEKITKFLEWFSEQRTILKNEFEIEFD
uniref:RCC1 and BTB domain-containing protein 1-like n=1 Tax=Dermatophagoides pteronyssinus TaxID=6956 RepID=A0A6P6YKQ7_DERPT|nr:RCC1 and BTB domain-containing protein 1-like [Dermatophagoides pteronyssinus]